MILSLIAAADEQNLIGGDNKLLWDLPADMKHFRTTTSGHSVLMGRKTYESIGRPLPNRRNIVISRQQDLQIEGCEVAASLEQALALLKENSEDEVFVIGGGEIYKRALPLADRVYLTRVHTTLEGDTYFPELLSEEWKEVSREEHEADETHAFAYTFLVYEKQ